MAAGTLFPATSATAIRRGPSPVEESVVVVAADGLGGAGGEGYVDAGDIGSAARDQPALDFASDFDVALHGNVIAQDQCEENQQANEGQ